MKESLLSKAASLSAARRHQKNDGTLRQTFTTPTGGLLSFSNLTEGTYVLTETKPPAGYRDSGLSVEVTASWDANTMRYAVTFSEAYSGKGTAAEPLLVENVSGTVLPNTGGAGILPYTAGGLLLMATAGLLMYSQKRRRKEDSTSS